MEGVWERRERELNAAITSFWRNYRRGEVSKGKQDRSADAKRDEPGKLTRSCATH